jgi:hypothetical protein
VHGDAREMGQNGEEAKGISAPCSPWAMVACRGGSAGGGRLEVAALRGGSALVLRKEGGSVVAVWVEPGSCRPLFIDVGRWLSGRYFELEDLLRPAMAVRERSRRGLGRRDSRPIGWWRCWTRPVVQGVSWLCSGDAERTAGCGGAVDRGDGSGRSL